MSGDGPSLGMLSAAITDLAQKVEAIESRVENGAPSDGPGEEFEGRVRAIETVLTDLRKAVTKLTQNKVRDDAERALRRPWHMLTDDQAEQRWLALYDWVEWFVVRNNVGPKEIPDCWFLHGGLVDELEALRWAWIESNKPESKMTDPVWWREGLHRARPRWPLFNPNGCATTHTESRPRAIGSERDWNDFLAEELADRTTAGRPALAS